MHKTKIQLATRQDLAKLVEFENICFSADRLSRQSFRNLLSKNSAAIFIATEASTLIACAVIFFRKNSRIARIYSIAVHPDFRGQGIANQLLQHIEKAITTRACHAIILEVREDNLPAIRFYEKNGYKTFATYPKFYEDGTDALRMKKTLE